MSWFRSWFRTEEKSPESEAEKKLKQVADILFPPLHSKVAPEGNHYQVDYSADSNLDAALIDLEEGNNDIVSQNTIRSVANKLFEVRKLLEVYPELNPEAKYLVVDDQMEGSLDHIDAPEEPHA